MLLPHLPLIRRNHTKELHCICISPHLYKYLSQNPNLTFLTQNLGELSSIIRLRRPINKLLIEMQSIFSIVYCWCTLQAGWFIRTTCVQETIAGLKGRGHTIRQWQYLSLLLFAQKKKLTKLRNYERNTQQPYLFDYM